jgi:hypothetical protein
MAGVLLRRAGNAPRMVRVSPARRSTLKADEALVARFNAAYPAPGVLVLVELDSGEIRLTRTRSLAQMLSGHTPVIWLEGISGCYWLKRIRVVNQKSVCEWCREGNLRTRSSVSRQFVHTDTPVGRVVCTDEEGPLSI